MGNPLPYLTYLAGMGNPLPYLTYLVPDGMGNPLPVSPTWHGQPFTISHLLGMKNLYHTQIIYHAVCTTEPGNIHALFIFFYGTLKLCKAKVG